MLYIHKKYYFSCSPTQQAATKYNGQSINLRQQRASVCTHMHVCVCVHMYGKQYMVNRYSIQPTYMNFCIILTSNENLLNVHIICFSSLCNAKPFSPLPIYTEHFILIPDPHEIHEMHGHMYPIVLTFISGNQNIPHSIKST